MYVVMLSMLSVHRLFILVCSKLLNISSHVVLSNSIHVNIFLYMNEILPNIG